MNATRKVVNALAISIAVHAGVLVLACGASTPDHVPTVAAYQAEQLACVDKAASLEESRACRAAVKAKYAPLFGKDAGHE